VLARPRLLSTSPSPHLPATENQKRTSRASAEWPATAAHRRWSGGEWRCVRSSPVERRPRLRRRQRMRPSGRRPRGCCAASGVRRRRRLRRSSRRPRRTPCGCRRTGAGSGARRPRRRPRFTRRPPLTGAGGGGGGGVGRGGRRAAERVVPGWAGMCGAHRGYRSPPRYRPSTAWWRRTRTRRRLAHAAAAPRERGRTERYDKKKNHIFAGISRLALFVGHV
jgi:hypothetical protein